VRSILKDLLGKYPGFEGIHPALRIRRQGMEMRNEYPARNSPETCLEFLSRKYKDGPAT
jgi:hypothetical protein